MKNKQILCSIAISFLLSLVILPTQAKGDFHIKKKRHTDAVKIMGQSQPAKDEEGATWMGKDKMREDEGQTKSTIVRFDLKKIYIIEHDKKQYAEIDLPVDFEKILPPQAKQMMQMMNVTAKVTPTQETQTINEWNCTKYLVEIAISMMGMDMPMKMEMWVTKDTGINLDQYAQFYAEMISIQPMFKDFAQEFQKIDGYPVKTEMTMSMMGTETRSLEEVISVEELDAPAGIYDIPEGFTKTDTYNPFDQKR